MASQRVTQRAQSPASDFDVFAKQYVERVVQIPSGAITWLRRDRIGSQWDAYSISFPVGITEEAILQEFRTNMLVPRPTFSIRSAVSGHRLPFAGGLTLLALGLVGVIRSLSYTRKTDPSATAIQN
jgi:hypothetical protein